MITQLILAAMIQAEAPQLQPWEVPSVEVTDETPQVFLVSREQKRACPRPGTVCLSPGGSATMRGVETVPFKMPVTVLARGARIAARGGLGPTSDDQPWQVEMVARFAEPSSNGPVIVQVFDCDDQQSILDDEPKVLWTVNMERGRELGMRFLLSPEDEFEPSHTYRVRVVQAGGSAARVLAEGDVHLE